MSSNRLQSLLPQLRESSVSIPSTSPISLQPNDDEVDEGFDQGYTSNNRSMTKLGNINTSATSQPDSDASSIDLKGEANSSCLARADIAQRMYDTMARVQSNRRSRRARLQQREFELHRQQQQEIKQGDRVVKIDYQLPQKNVSSGRDHSAKPQLTTSTTSTNAYRKQNTLQHPHRGSPPAPEREVALSSMDRSMYSPRLALPRPGTQVVPSVPPSSFPISSSDSNEINHRKISDAMTHSSPLLSSHFSSFYDPIRRSSVGTPIVFRDNISLDNTSVCTGLSQQDLLRKKVREHKSTNRNRQKEKNASSGTHSSNNGRRSKKKKKATIVQLPVGFATSSISARPRHYVKTRARDEVSNSGRYNDQNGNDSDPMVVWNCNDLSNSRDHDELQKRSQTRDKLPQNETINSRKVPLTSTETSTAETTDDDEAIPAQNSDQQDRRELDAQSVSSFPILSRSAKNGGLTDCFDDEECYEVIDGAEIQHALDVAQKPNWTQTRKQVHLPLGMLANKNNSVSFMSRDANVELSLSADAHSSDVENRRSVESKLVSPTRGIKDAGAAEITAATILMNSANETPSDASSSSTTPTTSTSLESPNRVRFSSTIATYLEPRDLQESTTQSATADIQAKQTTTSRNKTDRSAIELDSEVPYDEISAMKNISTVPTTLQSCCEPSKQRSAKHSNTPLQSILRTPRFSGQGDTKQQCDENSKRKRRSSDREDRVMWTPTDSQMKEWKSSLQFMSANLNILKRNFGIQFDGIPERTFVDESISQVLPSTGLDKQQQQNESMRSNESEQTSLSIGYHELNSSCEVSPPRGGALPFIDKEGFELSPIRPDRPADEVNTISIDEPISHITGHPAEKHWRESQLTPQRSTSLSASGYLPSIHEIYEKGGNDSSKALASCDFGRNQQRDIRHVDEEKIDYNFADAILRTSTADETSVASAFAFIQTVAAIVIQTAVRRYQATCLAEDLSFSKRYEGDIVDSYVSKTPKGTTRQLFSEIEDDNDTINSRQALLAPNVSYESVSDSPYHGSMGDAFLSLYEQAAVRIQAVFRSFWVRDSLDVDHYCATILQKWVRRHVRRRDFEKKSRQIIIVQSWWRRNIARDYAGEIIFYVVWIQAVYRGYRARQLSQQLELLKKSKQQLQVQRALQSRREYFIQTRKEPLATKKYDCGDRLPQKDDMVAVRAAIKIQSRWRMFVCECAFIRSLVDILIAQTVVRRWLASRLVASIRRANAPSSPTENATNPVRNSVALEHMKIGDCHDPATSLDLSGPFRNDLKPESVDTGLNISCQSGSENDNLSKSIDIDEILGMADRMLVHSRDPADLDRISTRYSDTPTSENPSDESNARRTPTIDDGDLRIAPQPDGDFTGTAQNSSSVANDDISRNTISFCNVSAQPLKDIHCVGTSAKERIPRSTLEGRINEAEVILKRKGMPADASVNPSSSSPVSGTNSFRQSRGQRYTAGSRNMEQTKKAPDPAGIRLATRQSLTTDLRDIQGRFQEAKKSFNVGAAGKSRRVEQFFQKSPQSDSPNGLHLNAKPNDTARRNADLEYGSGRFDDNQVASNQETVLDDAFTELDPLNTKNVFSVWKDKVKLSQANAGKR